MDTSPPVSALAGVLHVGEPSLPLALASIKRQQDVSVDVLEIGHLPKAAAHDRLFAAFTADAGAHEVLVKVDADMELVEPRLLCAIGTMFRRHRGLDVVVLGVDDWFSGERIMGLWAWRGGVRWTSPPPDLFTDLAENTARGKLKVMDAGRPLVLHGIGPSDDQAVRYGAHRALKAVATGKASRLERLAEFVRFVEVDPQPQRRLALAAAELALRDPAAGRRMVDVHDGLTPAELEALRKRSTAVRECAAAVQELSATSSSQTDEVVAVDVPPRRFSRRFRDVVQHLRIRAAPAHDGPNAWAEDFLHLLHRASQA